MKLLLLITVLLIGLACTAAPSQDLPTPTATPVDQPTSTSEPTPVPTPDPGTHAYSPAYGYICADYGTGPHGHIDTRGYTCTDRHSCPNTDAHSDACTYRYARAHSDPQPSPRLWRWHVDSRLRNTTGHLRRGTRAGLLHVEEVIGLLW